MTSPAPEPAGVFAAVRRNARGVGIEIAINFVLPFLVYDLTRSRLGDVHALMASSAPPMAWAIVEFLRKRRVDALSMLVLTGIGLSLLAYFGGGGVRFLQLRERMVTAAIGLLFLGSAAVGRPLIYYLARATMQRRSPSEAESFEAISGTALFKHTMLVMTLVWGAALVAEAGLAVVLVFRLSIREYLLVNPAIGYVVSGSLALWSFLYARRQQRIGRARRAAAEAAAGAAAQA